MSNTAEWANRQRDHRYTYDERRLIANFERELDPIIGLKMINPEIRDFLIGSYDLVKEPWRMIAIMSFRKLGLKFVTKLLPNGSTEITARKEMIR